jgi:hypothetical protein
MTPSGTKWMSCPGTKWSSTGYFKRKASIIQSHVIRRWDGKEATRETEGCGFEFSRARTHLRGKDLHVQASRWFIIFFYFLFSTGQAVLVSPTSTKCAICPVLILVCLAVVYPTRIFMILFSSGMNS